MTTLAKLDSRSIIARLVTFVAVAETLSFRRAAEIVGRSQPSVTSQIQQLEAVLGIALFNRTTRSVVLTLAGEELLARSKKLLAETERLIEDFHQHSIATTGRIVMSIVPTASSAVIAKLLVEFESKYPQIDISIREELHDQMLEALRTTAADIGIGPEGVVPDWLFFHPLIEQQFYLLTRADDEIAQRSIITIRDLEQCRLLLPKIGTAARAVLDEAAKAEGVILPTRYDAFQNHTLVSMASAGFGATVIPFGDHHLLPALNLVARPVEGLDISLRVGLFKRRAEKLSPSAMALIDLLKVESKKLRMAASSATLAEPIS